MQGVPGCTVHPMWYCARMCTWGMVTTLGLCNVLQGSGALVLDSIHDHGVVVVAP